MSHPLAVITPVIGARSDTFIQRHMRDLLPGGTVVVSRTLSASPPDEALDCPLLDLNHVLGGGLKRELIRATTSKLGFRPADEIVAKRFLRSHGVEVVLGEYLDLSLPWLGIAQELGARFFGHAHGIDVSMRLRESRWRREYLRHNGTAGVITMSHASRARLVDLGLAPEMIHVIPYGVQVPVEPVRREERNTVRCLAVGRMVPKKGPILTLDSFRRAAHEYPELRLDYVGGGPLLPAARQFVRALELEQRVTLHGSQPNDVVLQLMKRADLFVQHSIRDPDTGDEEGLPVSILEAMAHALPVVSTRHSGIPEEVVEHSTGYLVDEGDTRSMAERIAFLARNPDLRRQMGEAGWRRARKLFSWERERAELLRIFGLRSP